MSVKWKLMKRPKKLGTKMKYHLLRAMLALVFVASFLHNPRAEDTLTQVGTFSCLNNNAGRPPPPITCSYNFDKNKKYAAPPHMIFHGCAAFRPQSCKDWEADAQSADGFSVTNGDPGYFTGIWVAVGPKLDSAAGANFPYTARVTVYYIGNAPINGKYLQQNFFVAITPKGVAPKDLWVLIDLLSEGSIVAHTSCGPGEIQSEWTIVYRGGSCNWPEVISAVPGKPLMARASYTFLPLIKKDEDHRQRSTTRVITHPVNTAQSCPPPQPSSDRSSDSITVNVYQLPGAISPTDGALDASKVCIVATPHGQDVIGLRVWGSLVARKDGEDHVIGSYICVIRNPPDVTKAEEIASCLLTASSISPDKPYLAPDKVYLPKGATLYVATTVTFGVRSAAGDAVPVETYGPVGPSGR
jgi:hypothetical protein